MEEVRSLRFRASSETTTTACFLPSPRSARQISPRLGLKSGLKVVIQSLRGGMERFRQRVLFMRGVSGKSAEVGCCIAFKPGTSISPAKQMNSAINRVRY